VAKGVFRGFVTGVVISGVGVGALSLIAALPDGPAPETGAVEVPAGSDFQGKREDSEPNLPATPDDAPKAGDAPRMDTPPKDGDPLDKDATKPADRPETGTPANTLTPPVEGENPADRQSDTDTAPTPATDVQKPAAPAGAEAPISTDPAQPPAPAAPEDKAFPDTPQPTPVDATPGAEENEPPAPSKRADPLPSVTGDSASDEANRPRIGTPAGNLTDKNDTEQAEPPVVETPAQRPIVANAAPFDNPEAKPLMSIVLLDEGADAMGLEALSAFPYPLSFAVDPLAPDAVDRMQRYRDAGFEVLALLNMPQGATATDTESLMRASLAKMTGVVAVMEGDQTGLQSDKPVSDQAAAILAETGHGLVLFPKGLNTAQKLAAKEGVPAATVFRDFDAKEQSAQVIRRFLDQAAFKARQDQDGVIMLGRLRPDTISALLLWGLQDRAASVALAPISALLLAQQEKG
jgi:polysaccharide deacetylase 2 family uncharacterized protein YibQ